MYKIIAMLVCLMIRLWICIFKSWQIILHLNFTWISCPRKLMWPNYFIPKVLSIKYCSWNQCDQIGRFFCFLGKHSKLMASIILPKLPTLVGNFCKGVKIIHYSSEIILGNFYKHLAIFYWSHCFEATA